MKKSELNQFTAVLQPIDGWYTALTRGEKRQLIVTDAPASPSAPRMKGPSTTDSRI